MPTQERIIAVHLDLKGVPPTAERLVGLVPVFKAAGYNAILVEWEDMFPWEVDRRFRCETAYSREEVGRFHAAAAREGLEIVPLVQCLGHMETVLRFPEYAALREVPQKSDVINPLATGARELVEKMIDDVLALSPGLRYFHLGGDEAWTFGTHPETKAYIEKHGKGALYLRHVEPLLEKLLAKNIRPILWHDMMIHWEAAALDTIAGKADLCVWGYRGTHGQTQSHWQPKYLELFRKHGIRMWGATAYKGAEYESEDVPVAETRQINCQAWADVAGPFDMKGLIATAWSRYSTDRVQDSPIDAALDVLVLCGRILRDGKPPAGGLRECVGILEKLGEGQRFAACQATMRELEAARKSFWRLVQFLREAIACATIEPRRSSGGTQVKYFSQLKEQCRVAEAAGRKAVGDFAGLVPAVWMKRYAEERLMPMREEVSLLAAAVRKIDPAGFAAALD